MSSEGKTKGLVTSESNTSLLIGEGISSRGGSPSDSTKAEQLATTAEKNQDETTETEEAVPKIVSQGGKPPRVSNLLQPRPSPAVERSSSAGHTRKQSLDEINSATSGLTDDAGEYVDLTFRRNNSVSWDKDVAPQDPDLDMPMIGDTIDTANPVPPLSPPTVGSAHTRAKRNWGKVRESLELKEVNPLETEAEAAILRAVEKTRRMNAAKAGHIMPHVSEEAADVLKQDGTPEQNDLNKRNTEDRSVLSGTTAASKSTKGHNRTKTLDHTLFDLANQMNHLQNDPGVRERAGTADGTGVHGNLLYEDVTGVADYKGNSGDVLVHNAAMLFRRSLTRRESIPEVKSEATPPHPPQDSPTSLRENLIVSVVSSLSGDAKKADGDEILEASETSEDVIDVETGIEAASEDSLSSAGQKKKHRFGIASRLVQATNHEVKQDFDTVWRFVQPRSRTIKFYVLFVVCCLIIPLIAVAAILFNTGNPGLGREGASTSWLLLFICRQIITGTLARCTEIVVIDLLTLHLRVTARIFGTIFTLLLVQAKGWPSLVFYWGLYNFAMNSGQNPFAQHWLFWQDAMPLFNASNPSGTIAYSYTNYMVNGIAVTLGFIVALKRLWWGLYLGKRAYRHYGDELAKVMKDMVLISKVALWSKDIEKYGKKVFKKKGFKSVVGDACLNSHRVADLGMYEQQNEAELLDYIDPAEPTDRTGKVIDEEQINELTSSLTLSQKMRIDELLGRWEEPEIVGEDQESVSIASIIQFREMLAYMDDDYPFSLAFGPADTRDACIESAQSVYSRLMRLTPDEDVLPFDTLAVVGKNKNGEINTDEMKELIRLFRPERNGNLTCLDFVKSCDQVFRAMRLLRASIANSGQIDHAFEILVNIVFYIIVVIIILVVLKLDPLALFVSISGIILAFAFMISSASSKYFEGILFILVRRPYDIGDRIAVSNPESSCSIDGSATWFVQSVGLFTTSVRFAATNEVATLANSSLAASRVINAKRSPQANAYIYMKFSVDVPYSKVLIFRKAVETFVKERPREWIALNGFRATRVEQDLGFIEYIIALGHRSSWQDVGVILQSKADVASFCLELAKKLGMRYSAPPLPVNLNMAAQSTMQLVNTDQMQPGEPTPLSPGKVVTCSSSNSVSSPDVRSISALFKKEA